MSAYDRSGRIRQELPEILTAIAAPRVPDYFDDLLAQAAATPQRPRWTFIERWLPVGAIARRRAFVPTIPWRPILVAALLLALVATALLIAGSQRRPPPPFGVARNGAIVFDRHGDIAGRDSLTGTSHTLVGGPGDDFAAGYTRDGTRLVFLRRTAGPAGSSAERIKAFVADADGSNSRAVTGDLVAPQWFDWSPDDQKLVIGAGGPNFSEHVYLVDAASGGAPLQLDAGRPMTSMLPNFLGPTGAEIVFRAIVSTEGGPQSGVHSGLFAVHPDGSGLRPLTPADGEKYGGYLFPQPSPDGRYVAYTVMDDAEVLRIHLLDLTTGADRTVDPSSGRSQGWATFSPDSRQIVFVTYSKDRQQVAVEPVDGSAPATTIGPDYPVDDDLGAFFSPDGRTVIVNDSSIPESRLIDIATGGHGQILDWAGDGVTGWQRLAP